MADRNFSDGAAIGAIAGMIVGSVLAPTVALGAAAGVVAGILLAPKSGKKMRKELGDCLDEIKDRLGTELQRAGELTREKYGEVVDGVIVQYRKLEKVTETEAQQIGDALRAAYDTVKRATQAEPDEPAEPAAAPKSAEAAAPGA